MMAFICFETLTFGQHRGNQPSLIQKKTQFGIHVVNGRRTLVPGSYFHTKQIILKSRLHCIFELKLLTRTIPYYFCPMPNNYSSIFENSFKIRIYFVLTFLFSFFRLFVFHPEDSLALSYKSKLLQN